ncbi:MAG TPA: NADH-quinone oxidoreductase subunit D [Candidatus Binatia bacterium]|jgi:NADH-quinone oxidoreductase subunit D|nr:NADH-quinone oxidoreductase subunit D [Candidatus Binatia bacterium]
MSETALTSGQVFHTEDMTISVGPQHPSTHGVLRFVVKTDGEVISLAIPDVGYLHRSIEKIGEKVTWHGYVPYTDRADYLAAMFANQGFCMAAERLGTVEVTRRGEFCRVIACELNRIASHLISVGTFGQDIGAITPFLHALRERETINDLMEEICGARLTYNYIRIGGVGYDITPETCDRVRQFLDHFEPIGDEYNRLLSYNKIFVERLADVAVITKEDALQYNIVGPNLRACGVKWDIRRDIPYSVYPELEFEVPIGTGEKGTLGDSYDRYMVRIREMEESCKILRQCLKMMPHGPAIAKVPRKFKPPAGEAYVRIESSRGDMGFYVISDGSEYPYRVRIRTGSFTAMSLIEKISQGIMVADLIALIASLDVDAPEIDR